MSKRKRKKRTLSEKITWGIGAIVAGSMVLSLIIVALPSGPTRYTPTPAPTWTLRPTSTPPPTATDLPFPTFEPQFNTATPTATEIVIPTLGPTEAPVGPELPTDTPTSATEATEPPAGPVLPTETPAITATVPITATPSGASLPLIFAVAGDSRNNPALYRRVLDAVATDGSQFLLHTGDLVNKGTDSQWEEFTEVMAGFTLPFHPVAGNHDSLDGGLEGYLEHSGAPATHYSFDRGPVHFTLTDSHDGGIGANELAWLRDDLSATNQQVKMVFLHHPPFDPDGTDHIMAYGNESFTELMAEQKVDYVFAGHIHAYAQEERDGVLYTITGGAGAPLYGKDHPLSFHHYLRITVQGEDVSIEIVKI